MKKGYWFSTWSLITALSLILLIQGYLKMETRDISIKAPAVELSVASPQTAKYLYLIIVDGLRADSLEKMPHLQTLAAGGSSGLMTVQEPTYSRPAYARIITGASSHINGINMNNQERKLSLPTLFDLARRSGLQTGASAYKWFYELTIGTPYRTGDTDENRWVIDPSLPVQYGYYYDDFNLVYYDEEIFSGGIEVMQEFNPNLLIVHSMEVDEMGHEHGALSTEYREAVIKNDLLIEKFVEAIPDPEESIIIVTGDHGHVNVGGHGGGEPEATTVPLVIYGKNVKVNTLPFYTQLDLAPTMAAVLGLPFTAYMEGRIIKEAFNWPEELYTQKTALLNEVHQGLVQQLYKELKIDKATDFGLSIDNLAAAVQKRAVLYRLLLFTAGLVALAAAIFITLKLNRPEKRESARQSLKLNGRMAVFALPAVAVYHLAYQLSLRTLNFGYSYSSINAMTDVALKPPLGGLIAFILFLLCCRLYFKTLSFHVYAPAAAALLATIALPAAAAWILQGDAGIFLPRFAYYIFYVFTLFQLMFAALLVVIGGAVAVVREKRAEKKVMQA